MVSEVPLVGMNATISDVQELLESKKSNFESISYIYVIDEEKRLKGVLSIKELFRLPKKLKVRQVMKRKIISVRPSTDQERVALLAIEHNLKAIPVVDKRGYFQGVYPAHVILNILDQENIEDMLRFAGIHSFTDPARSIMNASAGILIRKRIPWLIIGLVGGLIAALVVSKFQQALETEILLAAFIPAIAYIADAIGTQTQTIFIRTLSINHALKIKIYLWRELKVGMGLALLLSLLAGVSISVLWSIKLGIIIGSSFFATSIVAVAVAIIMPLVFFRLKIDPAIASGPFATVIRDIMSLLIYFGIATYALHAWGVIL